MDESNPQMRRSISMPVQPLHLEPKTLKRSAEKETVYATDDSEGEGKSRYLKAEHKRCDFLRKSKDVRCDHYNLALDNSDENYFRQRSSPAMVTDNSAYNDAEPTILRGLPKHLRSVRDFFANSVNPIFSIFRKSNTSTRMGAEGSLEESCAINTKGSNGQMSTKHYKLLPELLPNEQTESTQSTERNSKSLEDLEKSNEHTQERVVFSL